MNNSDLDDFFRHPGFAVWENKIVELRNNAMEEMRYAKDWEDYCKKRSQIDAIDVILNIKSQYIKK